MPGNAGELDEELLDLGRTRSSASSASGGTSLTSSEGSSSRQSSSSVLARNVIILACAVDAADKALLPATFKALEEQFDLAPSKLAGLTLAQSLAFSAALPLWGSLMRYYSARDLMVCGCLAWVCTTLAVAAANSYEVLLILRLLDGAALASVNPLGQAMLCDLVPEAERGAAFGLLGSASSALQMVVNFLTTWAARGEFFGWLKGWRLAQIVVGLVSLLVALAVQKLVPATPPIPLPKGSTWLSEQRRVLRSVRNKPSFFIMVAQGVTGGIPWNAFAFLTLFFQLGGYSDLQAGQIMLAGGIGGIFGGVLGGNLGDVAAERCGPGGRVFVAQSSVLLGALSFVWMIFVPYSASSFPIVALACFTFYLVALWTQPAALRPICGEIFINSHDRAQVLALWIALEGIISALCGAPVCSMLSEAFGFKLSHDSGAGAADSDPAAVEQAHSALREALLGVSVVTWVLCFLCWVPMYWTYPRDREQARTESKVSDDAACLE